MILPEQPRDKTILIVSEDIGFVIWLGHMLAEGGYQPIPARTPEEVPRMMGEFQIDSVELVIMNEALPGASELINTLRNRHSSLKVIPMEPTTVRSPGSRSQSEWLSMVRKALGEELNTARG